MTLGKDAFDGLKQRLNLIKQELLMGEPELFTDKLIHSYNQWFIQSLDAIFSAPYSDSTQDTLLAFFDEHWNTVKGTLLSPTASPNSITTKFLCQIAPLICGEKKPIEILCTDMQWEAIRNPPYRDLDKTIPLEEIIKTHIVSDDGESLIPVSLLAEERFINYTYQKSLRGSIAYNPYDLMSKPTSTNEFQRLIQHSKLTTELNDSVNNFYKLNTENNADLYSQLDKLCKNLRLQDAHQGVGRQEQVGEGAFVPLAEFGEFYAKLSIEQKAKIPPTVKTAIDNLIRVAGDYDSKGMVERIETCAGTRREEIEKAMKGNEQVLLGITLDKKSIEEEKLKKLNERDQLSADLAKQLQPNEQGESPYQRGSEKLGFNKTLLTKFNLQFHVRNLDDLEIFKRLDSKEIHVLLHDNTALQKEILDQLSSIHDLTVLTVNFNVKKLHEFLNILGPKLGAKLIKTSMDVSELLFPHVNPETVELLTFHFGQRINPRYDVLEPAQVDSSQKLLKKCQDIEIQLNTLFSRGRVGEIEKYFKGLDDFFKPWVVQKSLEHPYVYNSKDLYEFFLKQSPAFLQPEDYTKIMLESIANGHFETLEVILKCIPKDKLTEALDKGLILASKNKDEYMVSILLENNANIYHQANHHYGILECLETTHNYSLVNRILSYNTNSERRQSFLDAALLTATQRRDDNDTLVGFLLARGARPNIHGNPDNPYTQAAETGSKRMLKTLLSHDCDKQAFIDEALFKVVGKTHKLSDPDTQETIVKLLLERGANPNAGSKCILVKSFESGNPAITKLLLENHANPNREVDDVTPLKALELQNFSDFNHILLEHGALIPAPEFNRRESLWIQYDKFNLAHLLFEQGIGLPNVQNPDVIIDKFINKLVNEPVSAEKAAFLKQINFHQILKDLLKVEAKCCKDHQKYLLDWDKKHINKGDAIADLVKRLLDTRNQLIGAKTFDASIGEKFATDCTRIIDAARPELSKARDKKLDFKRTILGFVGKEAHTTSEGKINSLKENLTHYKASCATLRKEAVSKEDALPIGNSHKSTSRPEH